MCVRARVHVRLSVSVEVGRMGWGECLGKVCHLLGRRLSERNSALLLVGSARSAWY